MRILIVDDEKPIRQWFNFCIKDHSKYKVVGEASDGQQAYEMFIELKPDLVITDIKMPIMDGLDLMQKIKLVKPDTEIVLLTSYDDFKYARFAIRQGATDYILKSETEQSDILNLLNHIDHKINNKTANSSKDSIITNDFFNIILDSDNSENFSIVETLKEQNIFLQNENIFAIAIFFEDINTAKKSFIETCQSYIKKYFTCYYYIDYYTDKDIVIIIGNLDFSNDIDYKGLIDYIHKQYNCTIGISNNHNNTKYIKKACEEAIKSVEQKFFGGNKTNIFNSDISNRITGTYFIMEKEIVKAIDENNINAIMDKLDELIAYFRNNTGYNIKQIYKVYEEIIHAAYIKKLTEKDVSISFSELSSELWFNKSLVELNDWAIEKINEIFKTDKYFISSYSIIIQKAIDYIKVNYSNQINLKEISEFVHLSPSYFSKVFCEEVGEPFSQYLLKYRLNIAKKLLQTSQYKIYEVACLVGYTNLSYFSRVFRKHIGKNPSEI